MDLDLIELNHWLDQFINFERRPDKNLLNLSTMKTLCEFFGHPELACPCFHVAGSKGKGTISASIASILNAAGYKTGVYASPHVLHFTERIGTGKEPFPTEIYEAATLELQQGIKRIISENILPKEILTWYELVTVFSFLCFRKAKVDFAVFEVGIGGRLDATNIVSPICIAMGPIELEHTEILGDTLTKIAFEKAGVFKEGIPIVSAPQAPEVQEVFSKIAKEKHTSLNYVPKGDYLSVDKNIAKTAVEIVFPDFPKEKISKGLESVSLPGRYELVKQIPDYQDIPFLLLDGAHTKNSVREVLARAKNDHLSGNLLFGCAADKNVHEMAQEIKKSGLFNQIFLTRPGDFKKSNLPKIEQAFLEAGLTNLQVDPDFRTFIPEVLRTSNHEKAPLFVLGSFYLVGEVKRLVTPKEK